MTVSASQPFANSAPPPHSLFATTALLLKSTFLGVSLTVLSTLSTPTWAAISPPEMDNIAYILMDYDTGVILAQKNAHQPLPPASLTKMMTSYIIEQKLLAGELKENQPILMSENAWCRGSNTQSCMYVPVNQSAPVIDMLRGIIIQSGNDASKAMAEHLAGSEEAFSKMMNAEAARLGMKDSQFKNATGMPVEGHVSSAYDLALLARAIIKEGGSYYKIYSEKEFTYNNVTQGNRNALLNTDPTVDGLKTGHTDAAGYCLVASSKRDDMRLITVIMGAKSMQIRADQSRQLLNWGFGHFETVLVAPAKQSVETVPVQFGVNDSVALVTAQPLKVLITKVQKGSISTRIDIPSELSAPITKGQQVGNIMAVVEGKTVASAPIIAAADVAEAGFFKRTWQQISRWFGGLF